jgi:mRNA interferase RelE/StbE
VKKWEVRLMPNATKSLERLSPQVMDRILLKLYWLAEHFDEVQPEPLHGEWEGYFKLRVGDWRAVYTIDRQRRLIVVHAVGHRRQIYRQL